MNNPRVHPLQGAAEIGKKELDPTGAYQQSIIREVWGDNPPFATKLTAQEKKDLFKFVLTNPAFLHDFQEKFGEERVAKMAAKYSIDITGEEAEEQGAADGAK